MHKKFQAMLDELKLTGDMTRLAEKEDEIARVTGDEFMEGRVSYDELEGIKNAASEIEEEQRKQFECSPVRVPARVR